MFVDGYLIILHEKIMAFGPPLCLGHLLCKVLNWCKIC